MIACIVGKGKIEFVDEESGDVIEGIKLHYFAPKDEVDGFFSSSIFIRKNSKLYSVVEGLNTERPFLASIEYDQQPGSKRVITVLCGIRPLESADIEALAHNVFWQSVISMFSVPSRK